MFTQEGEKNFDSQVPLESTVEDFVEQRELDLSNAEDLEVFLESAEGVYADALQYKEVAEADNYSLLDTEDLKGGEIFQALQQRLESLQEIVDYCRLEIIPNEGEIEDEKIELIQKLYDDMIFFRNHIQDVYSNLPEEEEVDVSYEQEVIGDEILATNVETEDVAEKIVEEGSEETTKFEVFNSDTEVPVSPVELSEEVETVIEVEPVESIEVTSALENLFEKTEKIIEEIRTEVLAAQGRMSSLFHNIDTSDEIQIDLNELDICVNRINDIQEKIQSSKGVNEDEAVQRGVFAKYERVAHEIEKNAHSIEQVLLLKYKEVNALEVEPKVELNEIKSDSDSSEEVLIAPVAGEGDSEDSVEEQSETKVPILSEEVAGNQFYTEDEEQDLDGFGNSEIEISPLRRKTMKIEGTDEYGNISIQVAKNSEKLVKENADKMINPLLDSAQIVASDVKTESATAVIESEDPVSEIVPNNRPTVIHALPTHEERSLTKEFLADERYSSFIKSNYTSPAAFERMLDTTVTKIESETVDFIERFLKEEYTSPFAYMQNMSVAEVEKLSMQPDIRNILAEENIKYDTFVQWIDLLPEMQSVVGNNPNIKFGELYARWMVEGAIEYYEEREAA